MIQAMQTPMTITSLQRVKPQQLYAPTAVTPGQFDITTLLTSIMPLIMLVLVMQMLKPMMGGMTGA